MWIFTPHGVLFPAAIPTQHIDPRHPDRKLAIRSRRREYLTHFRREYLGAAKRRIWTGEELTGHAQDYPYRLFCSPEKFTAAIGKLTAEIVADGMERFKLTTEGKRGLSNRKLGRQLHSTYTRVWRDLLALSDGTSSYDIPPAPKFSAATYRPQPALCKTEGHWYPDKSRPGVCVDCGHVRGGLLTSAPQPDLTGSDA